MTARMPARRCPGRDRCRPESRCPEHRIDVDPEPIGAIVARLFATAPTGRR